MTAVGSPEPKRTTAQLATQAVRDFADGAIRGAQPGSSIAATLGDIAASAVPVLGEQRSLKDLYEGVTSGNVSQLVTGLIGLMPVAGTAARTAGQGGQKLVARATQEVTEKGVSAAALNLSRAAAQGAREAVKNLAKNPKLKAELAKAGERAFERTSQHLQERLLQMAQDGKLPDLVTRTHDSFIDARKAAFAELGAQPDASWQSLFAEGADGKRKVVGKHQPVPEPGSVDELISQLGFRFIEPDASAKKPGEASTYQLMWWKSPAEGDDPKFGLEAFKATDGEAGKIFEAYLNQSKSFRPRRST